MHKTGKTGEELMPVDGDPSEFVPDDADGDAEVENEPEDESEESQQLKRSNDPVLPSKEEIEAHRRTHLPYRCWCKFCIAGRGTGIPHASMPHQSRIPIVHLDYFFVTSSGVLTRQELETQYPKSPEGAIALDQARRGGEILKCILIKCGYSKAEFAHPVPCKGLDEEQYVVGLIAQAVQWLGHVRVIMKGDNERSLQATIKAAMLKLKVEMKELEQISDEQPPKHDSQSHGSAESGVKSVRGPLRTLRLDLESRLERQIPVTHPLMHWLVEHAALLTTAMRVGEDGVTSWNPHSRAAFRPQGLPFMGKGHDEVADERAQGES